MMYPTRLVDTTFGNYPNTFGNYPVGKFST